MEVSFPYKNVESFEISDDFGAELFDLPDVKTAVSIPEIVKQALAQPIASERLCVLAVLVKRP